MSVEFRKNEEGGVYELTANVDGQDVPIFTVPTSTVESHVQRLQAAAESTGDGGSNSGS